MYTNDAAYQKFMQSLDEFLIFSLSFDMDPQKATDLVKDIKKFYFNDTFTDKNRVTRILKLAQNRNNSEENCNKTKTDKLSPIISGFTTINNVSH